LRKPRQARFKLPAFRCTTAISQGLDGQSQTARPPPADFNFDLHAARRISYIGVTFRTRSIEEIREIFNEARNDGNAVPNPRIRV
jgi:hypothetical protein